MASVGEQLKSAREKQGLSIPQIAERTKLRSDHVRARSRQATTTCSPRRFTCADSYPGAMPSW